MRHKSSILLYQYAVKYVSCDTYTSCVYETCIDYFQSHEVTTKPTISLIFVKLLETTSNCTKLK